MKYATLLQFHWWHSWDFANLADRPRCAQELIRSLLQKLPYKQNRLSNKTLSCNFVSYDYMQNQCHYESWMCVSAVHCDLEDCSAFTMAFNPLALELDIYSLAHHLCKMWIFYEPRRVTLGNTRHFVEE